jgi:uncharacterized glyoxalase superfamily protein PhnB
MIQRIAPQFFTLNLPETLAYYEGSLGFECTGQYGDPPFYAIVQRDGHAIHFRLVDCLPENPDKYAEELLDAYITVDDPDGLYNEFRARGVVFSRELADMPWQAREFVVKDCDGRLLCFGGPPRQVD